MRNLSSINPNLSSWINAILLASLLIIGTSLIPILHQLWMLIVVLSAWIFYFISIILLFIGSMIPQFLWQIIIGMLSTIVSLFNALITLISPFILLLPIPIVAFAHHFLYLLLDRFYPDLETAERGRVTGYLPGIASWWHGLFALVVVIMAMLISDSVLSILPIISSSTIDSCGLQQLSSPEVYGAMELLPDGTVFGSRLHLDSPVSIAASGTPIDFWVQIALRILGQPIYRPLLRLIIWFVSAAYIYQFEFSFKEHLVAKAIERNGDR